MTSRTPYDAFRSLSSSAAAGDLAKLCERHGVELLVVHGSVLDPEPLRPAQDLDLAFRYVQGAERDQVALINEILQLARFDAIDLMDLGRAGPVARARALAPNSVVLYEADRSIFAEAQIAAMTETMETRWMRRRDLELLGSR